MKNILSSAKERYDYVLERISYACTNSGRSEKEITLIGASKGQDVANIKSFINLGLSNIGESYFQEAVSKIPEILTLEPSINFHFIGHVQSNKTKKIIQIFDLIHSVDSTNLASEINQRVHQLNKRTELKIKDPFPILVQVNLSGETSKFGCHPDTTLNLIEFITEACPHIICKGLMVMAPLEATSEYQLKSFYKLVSNHHNLILDSFPECQELSCGMSNDFEIAIEAGSTMIRLGTVLFGPRTN